MTNFAFSRGRMGRTFSAIVLAEALLIAANLQSSQHPVGSQSLGKIPMYFEANRGQADAEAQFVARGKGYALFLTASEAVMSLRNAEAGQASLRMRLVGAAQDSRIEGVSPQSGSV